MSAAPKPFRSGAEDQSTVAAAAHAGAGDAGKLTDKPVPLGSAPPPGPLKVDSDIPLQKRQGSGRKTKYPFAELKVGDSFFVPGMNPKKLTGSVTHAQKRLGVRLACRAVEGGVRCWRTK